MTRRLESGPLLVTVGALLLLVSLFLTWYSGQFDLTAWDAFEVWDLVLAALGLGAVAAAIGLLLPDAAVVDRRWLPATVVAVLVIVAVAILDPPPAALGGDPSTGAWLALGAAVLMAAGAVLTFSRVRLAFTVEGRDPRQHVPAVDARGEPEPGTSEAPAAAAPASGLFARTRRPVTTVGPEQPPKGAAAPEGTAAARPRRPVTAVEPQQPPKGAATPEGTAAARAEDEEPLLRSRARRRQRATETGDTPEKDPG